MPKIDVENWGELVIALVVVVGSLFGAISKKLIAYFSPKTPETPELIGDAAKGVRPAGPVRREARPLPPIAPSQAPTARPVTTTAPSASPQPPRPVRIDATPRRVARPRSSVKPTARKARPATPRPTPPSRTPVADEPILMDEMVEDHLGHLTSMFEGEESRIEDGVERRLGHVESQLAASASLERKPLQRTLPALGTRSSLRQAIVLCEILGPPIALRPPDEQ